MKKIIFAALAFVLVATAAMAQGRNNRNQRMDPSEMYERMADSMVKELKLKGDAKDAFKTLYMEYQAARTNADSALNNLDEDDLKVKKMTDEQANKLIEMQMASQKAQQEIDETYLAKFQAMLTPVQTAQVFVRRLAMQAQMSSFRMPAGGFGGGMGGMGGGFGGGMGGFGGGMGGF